MKKIFFIFFIVNHFYAVGQNWSIINSTDKFNYKLDGENIISSTIWIDSVQVNSNDSVFYLNRIVCDSCITILNSPSGCDSCYGYKNAPNFLQKTILYSDSIYNLRDTGNIVIRPFAYLNVSWLFDSTWNISAQVLELREDSVFSNIHSVKVLLLSSGDTVKLSKSHGILQIPSTYNTGTYFRLAGIEGRNIGELVPKFIDFFDFDIGDRFEYHYEGHQGGGCAYWQILQYTITSKFSSGDTIRYDVSGVYESKYYPGFPWGCTSSYGFGPYNSTIEFIDSTDHFTNKFNKQPFNLSYHIQQMHPCAENDSAYDGVRIGIDSNNVFSKSFGLKGSNLWEYLFYTQYNKGSDTLFVNYNSITGPYHSTYKVGLGCTEYSITPCFEGGEIGYLTAYKKGNITVGTFSDSTAILLGINSYVGNAIVIYPNPANNKLYVRQTTTSLSTFKIFNSFGILVKEFSTNATFDVIDIEELSIGTYFVQSISKTGSTINRIIISR